MRNWHVLTLIAHSAKYSALENFATVHSLSLGSTAGKASHEFEE